MRHLGVIALFVVIAVIFTWPMATQMSTTVADQGDPLHLSWVIDWDIHALTHSPLRIFDAPIFYPAKYPLAFSENLIGIAILCLPFRLFGLGPIAIYNVALLLGFALSAWAAYVLGWIITRRHVPSLVAGLLYGFAVYRWGHLSHLQVIWSPCAPLLLAAILAYRRDPRVRNAALVGASLVANAVMNLYLFLFCAVALALSLIVIAVSEKHDARFWLRLGAALAIAGMAIAPVLMPYWIVAKEYRFQRFAGEALDSSATPRDWLIATGRSALYGPITDPKLRRNERELFPGMMLFFLGAGALMSVGFSLPRDRLKPVPTPKWLDIAIVVLILMTYGAAIAERVRYKWRGTTLIEFQGTTILALLLTVAIIVRLVLRYPRALAQSRAPLELWIAALWIAAGFIGSLGMHTFFHTFLFEYVPGFRSTRVPARWAMIAFTGLAAWAAAGMAQVKGWKAALLCALALVDVWPRIRWEHALVEPSEVDLWIRREKAGPLLMLPIDNEGLMYETLLRSTAHHQPMFDGLSSFEPPLHRELRESALDDKALALLERDGCRYVIVRPEWCGWRLPVLLEQLRAHLDSGRLAFVRRFDSSGGGDWVFAVTRVEENWQRFRAPAGPGQDLARFLTGQKTYSGITFGRLSRPAPNSESKGALEISG